MFGVTKYVDTSKKQIIYGLKIFKNGIDVPDNSIPISKLEDFTNVSDIITELANLTSIGNGSNSLLITNDTTIGSVGSNHTFQVYGNSTFANTSYFSNGLTVTNGTISVPSNSISTAAINGISQYATKASPTFTGTVTIPTLTVSSSISVPANSISTAAINGLSSLYATTASPTFTGQVNASTDITLGGGTNNIYLQSNTQIGTSVDNRTLNVFGQCNLQSNCNVYGSGGLYVQNGFTVAAGTVSVPSNSISTAAINGLSSLYATKASPTFTGQVNASTDITLGGGTNNIYLQSNTQIGTPVDNRNLNIFGQFTVNTGSISVPANSISTAAINGLYSSPSFTGAVNYSTDMVVGGGNSNSIYFQSYTQVGTAGVNRSFMVYGPCTLQSSCTVNGVGGLSVFKGGTFGDGLTVSAGTISFPQYSISTTFLKQSILVYKNTSASSLGGETTTATITLPSTWSFLHVTSVGGGGGGGSGSSLYVKNNSTGTFATFTNNTSGGGGGCAGSYNECFISKSNLEGNANSTISSMKYYVGKGGAGGTATSCGSANYGSVGNDGKKGGDTYLLITMANNSTMTVCFAGGGNAGYGGKEADTSYVYTGNGISPTEANTGIGKQKAAGISGLQGHYGKAGSGGAGGGTYSIAATNTVNYYTYAGGSGGTTIANVYGNNSVTGPAGGNPGSAANGSNGTDGSYNNLYLPSNGGGGGGAAYGKIPTYTNNNYDFLGAAVTAGNGGNGGPGAGGGGGGSVTGNFYTGNSTFFNVYPFYGCTSGKGGDGGTGVLTLDFI